MAFCYFISDENDPFAQKYTIWDNSGKRDIWLANHETTNYLESDLVEETAEWTVEEYFTEDDDHGDAFRYFDSETIVHEVTEETAIVEDDILVGAMYKNRVDGALTPVLRGGENIVRKTERLSETHDLDKQSRARLIHRDEK